MGILPDFNGRMSAAHGELIAALDRATAAFNAASAQYNDEVVSALISFNAAALVSVKAIEESLTGESPLADRECYRPDDPTSDPDAEAERAVAEAVASFRLPKIAADPTADG